MTAQPSEPMHEHRHNTPDGWRSFRHSHPMPIDASHPDGNRMHRHPNGRHSHPHGHARYLEVQP